MSAILDAIAGADALGDLEEAAEQSATAAHKAARDDLIGALLADSQKDIGYMKRSGQVPVRMSYTAAQHALDQVFYAPAISAALFGLLAKCERSSDPVLRLQAQAVLSSVADGFAADFAVDYEGQ